MVNQEHQMPHRCGIITARPAKPEVIAVQPEDGMVHQFDCHHLSSYSDNLLGERKEEDNTINGRSKVDF